MNYDDHRKKAERLNQTRSRLKDPDDWETYTENCYNAALQIIACICIKKFDEHQDIHSGVTRFLRKKGLNEVAERFDELDQLRHGRWYGNQSNGDTRKNFKEVFCVPKISKRFFRTIKKAKEIIEFLENYLENVENR